MSGKCVLQLRRTCHHVAISNSRRISAGSLSVAFRPKDCRIKQCVRNVRAMAICRGAPECTVRSAGLARFAAIESGREARRPDLAKPLHLATVAGWALTLAPALAAQAIRSDRRIRLLTE